MPRPPNPHLFRRLADRLEEAGRSVAEQVRGASERFEAALPPLVAWADGAQVEVRMPVALVERSTLSARLEADGRLVIKGRFALPRIPAEATWQHADLAPDQEFRRVLRPPFPVDPAGVEARIIEGVLAVTLRRQSPLPDGSTEIPIA